MRRSSVTRPSSVNVARVIQRVASLLREVDQHLARAGAAHEEMRCSVCRAVLERAHLLTTQSELA